MRRIIQIATNPGDIVMDPFGGSGTTAAVAHKLGRRWVTVEWRAEVLAKFTLPRLEKVVAGQDPGGVTGELVEIHDGDLPEGMTPATVRAATTTLSALAKHGTFDHLEHVDSKGVTEILKALRAEAKTYTELVPTWEGGGGFTVLDVAPSMFTSVNNMVFLSEWATSGVLAQVTAAQLGFAYAPDGPFVGRKGGTRLAVIDGLVNPDVVQVLVDRLGEDELLEIAATSIDQDAPALLRQLRRGSRLRKIPQAILRSYQRASRLQELLTNQKDAAPGGRPADHGHEPAGPVPAQEEVHA